MATKLGTARKMAGLGVTTHIAAMKVQDVLLRIVKGEQLGTTILPLKKKSNLKKWIAFSEARTGTCAQILPHPPRFSRPPVVDRGR